MKHVAKIKEMFQAGQSHDALEALENLLELGPHNLEALKLKAHLFASEGRFAEEDAVWQKIVDVAPEDEDLLEYLHKKQWEDRENYYFTDNLPSGGRRFLAYPRSMINVSFFGLIGCMLFLALTRMLGDDKVNKNPELILPAFAVLVLGPWIGIIWSYVKSLRHINVTPDDLVVATRVRSIRYAWSAIEKIAIAYSNNWEKNDIRLVVIPKDPASRPVEIDINDGSSPVRAKTHLIQEIMQRFAAVSHEPQDKLGYKTKQPIVF